MGFSLVAASGAYFLVVAHRLLMAVTSLVAEHGLSAHRSQWWGFLDSRAQAQ